MGFIDVKNTEDQKKEAKLIIPKDAFEKQVFNVYKKNVGRMSVPGFRKGKAPKGIIEKIYGKQVFYDEAIDDLLPDIYDEAVKESGFEIVSRPEIEVESIDENGVTLKCAFYVKPEVSVSVYKGLKGERPVVEVSDEEVQEEIDKALKRNSRIITVTDSPVIDGDEVIIDYTGSIDGVEFEGGKAEKQSLKIGSGSFIPGFEDQIIGKNVGDEFDINVTFPEDYSASELKGKPAVFAIRLHEIKRTEMPAFDEEFVKDVSEFDTVDDYKADIKAKITKRKQKEAERALDEELVKQLVENMTADIPQCMYDSEIDSYIREYENNLSSQGISMELFFQYTGMTVEKLREQFKERAEQQVKRRLALEFVAKAEGITVTEEDYEEEFKRMSEQYGVPVEQVKESIKKEYLEKDILNAKAFKFVKEAAEISGEPYDLSDDGEADDETDFVGDEEE